MRTSRTPELSDKEHRLPKGKIGRHLEATLHRETHQINSGGVRHIGASCLLEARAQ